jgi:hypothetical protein
MSVRDAVEDEAEYDGLVKVGMWEMPVAHSIQALVLC